MRALRDSIEATGRKIRNYADANAAIYLLHEALNAGAVVSIGEAREIVNIENTSDKPELGKVIQAIIRQAAASRGGCPWKTGADGKQHLEAAITIGGAVYTVNLSNNPSDPETADQYQVDITSKLDTTPDRGKLFFDEGYTASVKIRLDGTDLEAITEDGLVISATGRKPYPYQNEILAKYATRLLNASGPQSSCLAVLGTGSGKSVVMASIAQAVGPTIMVVPDTLVPDQISEVQAVLDSSHYAEGTSPHPGRDATSVLDFDRAIESALANDTMQHILFDYFDGEIELPGDYSKIEQLKRDDLESYSTLIKQVARLMLDVATKRNTDFDQIVLGAQNPIFKDVAPLLECCTIMIDESHQHTFSDDTAAVLTALQQRNAVVALTATPTSKLYKAFGDPIDDMNLHAATKLRKTRPIKAEVRDSVDYDAMVPNVIAEYFVDYYLQPGDSGYTDPYKLYQDGRHTTMQACIIAAMTANRVIPQRNMAFSGDKAMRDDLTAAYQLIASNEHAIPAALASAIRDQQAKADLAEATRLLQRFNTSSGADASAPVDSEVVHSMAALMHTDAIDLKAITRAQQITDLSRSINSFALNLVIHISAGKLAAKERTGDLQGLLTSMGAALMAYEPGNAASLEEFRQFQPRSIEAIASECGNLSIDDATLTQQLLKCCPSLNDLEPSQKDTMVGIIIAQAQAIRSAIRERNPIAALATQTISSSDYERINAQASYAVQVDASSDAATIARTKAQLRLGLCTHVISDHTLGTGLSIDDVMNVQLLHAYNKAGIDSSPDSMDSVIQVMQMLGRCVRKDDGRARCQQSIDKRYDTTAGIILRVDDAIAADSGSKMRDVTLLRDEVFERSQALLAKVADASRSSPVSRYNNIWTGANLWTEQAYHEAKPASPTDEAKSSTAAELRGF